MQGKVKRGAVIGMLALVAPLAFAAHGQAYTIGSNLRGIPNADVCEFESFTATDRPCTVSQSWLAYGHVSPAGLESPISGVIVRWSVLVGEASPDTVAVKLQLRTLAGGLSRSASGNVVDLPLSAPGTYAYRSFPERMPIGMNEEVGLTTFVTNRNGGAAGVPIAATAPELGEVGFWEGPFWNGSSGFQQGQYDTELLLNAVVEPDADQDGYGDETQDFCIPESGHQTPCPPAERRPPKAAVTYRSPQDLLDGNVAVKLRSDEAGSAFAGGRIRVIGRKSPTYALESALRPVRAGKRVTLRLKLSKGTREGAARALRAHRRVVAEVTAYAQDVAGNKSGETVATIAARH